jgi:acyl-CoA thioesterase-2
VGDLATDTSVTPVGDEPGRFTAALSPEWEIWGPMGGYVAACALRAAGATVPALLPATFSCHYLSVAEWGEVDIAVVARRSGRTATSLRVEIAQGDRVILDASVWAVAPGDGLEHDAAVAPTVPDHDPLPLITELVPAGMWPPFPFWNNLEMKPTDFEPRWPPAGPREPRWQQWLRFVPAGSLDDPWVDGARSVILIDLASWPSVQNHHAWKQEPYVAPTLDLNVAFHRSARAHEWLLADGEAAVSTGGLFGWTTRVWTPERALVASGGGQCKYRRLPG